MKRVPLRVVVSVRERGKSLSVRRKRPVNEFWSNKTHEAEESLTLSGSIHRKEKKSVRKMQTLLS